MPKPSTRQRPQLPAPNPDPNNSCKHDYRRVGYGGGCVLYECRNCGDEYDRDVS
jgi:hypothetical protein